MKIARVLSLTHYTGAWVLLLGGLGLTALVAGPPATGGAVGLTLGVAVVIATIVTLWHAWGRRRMVNTELERCCEQVARSAASDAAITPERERPWASRLRAAVGRRLAEAQQTLEQGETRRLELEDRVRLSDTHSHYLAALVENLRDGVIVTDAGSGVVTANTLAARMLGFEIAAARGRPIADVIDDATLADLIGSARWSGFDHPRRHEHVLRQAGGSRHLDLVTACVFNSRGEVSGVVTVLHDRTRERELAERKSDFVCSVSHELRTPLSSIKAYVEMLVDGEAEDEATRAEFYNIIQSETNRLSRLIDNMLSISRIESGVVKAQPESVTLGPVVREVLDLLQPQARAKQLTLGVEADAGEAAAYADRDMLHQALVNLLGNAIKYSPAGGRVRVRVQVDEEQRLVHLSVEDEGVGIPPQSLPYIFDKFYRVPQHKRLARGTGLGLNLVKHVVETVHGGHLSVVSEPGRGSTFTVTLTQSGPRVDEESVPTASALAQGEAWA